jgi:hypothetical protein
MASGTQSIRLPPLIVVYQGKREAITGVPDYNLLKSYLDRLLAQ